MPPGSTPPPCSGSRPRNAPSWMPYPAASGCTPHGDAATRVRDAVNAELKSRGMEPDARIFCELLNVEDESWQDCVEACLGDRRFDILVPPAHYAAAKSAFVALKEKVGPISLLDTPGLRKANRRADTAPADSLAAQVTSENPLAAQYADTILRRIVCCDTPRHAGKLPRQRHPGSSAPPSLPVGASAHPTALYRLGSPPRPRRGTGRGDERPCRRSTRRRTGGAEPESRLQPVPDPFARHNAGRTCRFVGCPRRLTAARAAVEEQAAKLAECRENPLCSSCIRRKRCAKPHGKPPAPPWNRPAATCAYAKNRSPPARRSSKKAVDTAEKERTGCRKLFCRPSAGGAALPQPSAGADRAGQVSPRRRAGRRKGTGQAGRCPDRLPEQHP